jgi:hypothetical protein
MTEGPTRGTLPAIANLIGRWFGRRCLNRRGEKRPPHLISSWTVDDKGCVRAIACCGSHLKDPVAFDKLGPWDPEDHLDIVCPDCLKWWRDTRPKVKVGEEQKSGSAKV